MPSATSSGSGVVCADRPEPMAQIPASRSEPITIRVRSLMTREYTSSDIRLSCNWRADVRRPSEVDARVVEIADGCRLRQHRLAEVERIRDERGGARAAERDQHRPRRRADGVLECLERLFECLTLGSGTLRSGGRKNF